MTSPPNVFRRPSRMLPASRRSSSLREFSALACSVWLWHHGIPLPDEAGWPVRYEPCTHMTRLWFVHGWLLLASLVGARTASAQSLTMTAGLELSQVYQPDSWQPVRVEFRNSSDRTIDGSVTCPLMDRYAPAVMKLPVSVPPHSRLRSTIWCYFPRPV